MKRKISLFLALALCLSLAAPAFAAGFTDVSPNDYCYDPVLWAVENKVTSGTTPTSFSPNGTCSVGEILTFLWRAEGEPTPMTGGEIPFSDVTGQEYYANPACWAYGAGLIPGGIFNAGAPCTRSMAMTYLWKLSGSPAAGSSSFTDVPAGAEYASAVAWAVEQGITSGTTATTFSPDQTCTRGQIATFLYRFKGSPAVTRPTVFYTLHPEVPDFGALAGIPLADAVSTEGFYSYCYDMEATSAASERSPSGSIIGDYSQLLTANGFAYVGNVEGEKGPVACFGKEGIAILLGLTTTGYMGVIIITADETSAPSGEFYSECPDVPDFGTVAGLRPTEKSQRPDGGWFYSYDGSAVTEAHLRAYMEKLVANGFQGAGYDANGYGAEFATFVKGGTTIMFGLMYGGAAVAVAVYY